MIVFGWILIILGILGVAIPLFFTAVFLAGTTMQVISLILILVGAILLSMGGRK